MAKRGAPGRLEGVLLEIWIGSTPAGLAQAKDSSSASESITSRDDDERQRRKGKLAPSQELIRFPLIKDSGSVFSRCRPDGAQHFALP